MAESNAVVRKGMPAELVGLRPAGAYTFDELYRLAQVCHASGMFKDTADAAQAMIKIVRGQEMGIPPTTAMTAFDIVRDRLFVKPWVIAAKINSCGYGIYRVLTQTDQACSILFRRKYAGEGWVDLPPITYTYAEAKAHGLVDRSSHWKASPAHMLYQRAMGRGGALYFPELLAGLEAPPDDTTISSERHQQHIVDLCGDDPRGSTPPPPLPAGDHETWEVWETGESQPTYPARKAAHGSQVDTSSQTTGVGTSHGEKGKHGPYDAKMVGYAWDTLRDHEQDTQLSPALREQIASALSSVEPATDAEAFALADRVLAWLDHAGE